MTTATRPSVVDRSTRHPESIFQRVIVGVDGSEAGFEACRQAARLVTADGWIEAFAAAHLAEAARAGWSASRLAEQMEREAAGAARKAERLAKKQAKKAGAAVPAAATEPLRISQRVPMTSVS